MENNNLNEILENRNENEKIGLLHNIEALKMNKVFRRAKDIIYTLSEQNIVNILLEKELLNKLQLSNYDIIEIIQFLKNDSLKTRLIEEYGFDEYNTVKILASFSDEGKNEVLLKNKYNLENENTIRILANMEIRNLINFINQNRSFLKERNIKIHEITSSLNDKKQLEFVSMMEECEISIYEGKQIFIALNDEVKEKIDSSTLPKEYKELLTIRLIDDIDKLNLYGKIDLDYTRDLEIYRGLDDFIAINPLEVEDKNNDKIMQLCNICPNLKLVDNYITSSSTVQEYKEGENWIASIIDAINPNWTDLQKLAFVDNAIGKRISYSPDFDTEVFDGSAARALWKIISTGYGVCNGIAQVEYYILKRVGINSKIVSSDNHTFLKIIGIEFENSKGETIKGDTIVDGTWNLSDHRYGAMPSNFGINYEEARKHDIDNDGVDTKCHQNDDELTSATIMIDDDTIRQVFKSIGITDKEGFFKIKNLIEKAEEIDNNGLNPEDEIRQQLENLKEYYPNFARCQNSTLSIIKDVCFNQKNLKFERCVLNRVYEKGDTNKEPCMYIFIELPNHKQIFYYVDKETNQFIQISQKNFEEKFECYEEDLKRNNGIRPWQQEELNINLENNNEIIAKEKIDDERS